MTLHIGILQTDRVSPGLADQHGDYPDMFQRLLDPAMPALTFSHYDVRQAVPDEIVCDAYVITGSKHSVYDELPWIPKLADFVAEVLAAKRKVVGVCFGHQLMAHFFGGHVASAEQGWAVGVHASQVVRREDWMDSSDEDIALLSSHRDQVVSLPSQAEVYLSNTFCPIGGFTMGEDVLTVQAHPEFDTGYAAALMDLRQELIGRDTHQRGRDSLTQETDEQTFARWMVNFMRGPNE